MADSTPMSLASYLKSEFKPIDMGIDDLDLSNEGHVQWWRQGAAAEGASVEDLVMSLPHLRVPVSKGASKSEIYRRLVLAGEPEDPGAQRVDEIFRDPSGVQVSIREHPAGDLPVLEFSDRADFERAFRALGSRCEPVDIPTSVHALYVSGLPNSVRASELRERWCDQGGDPSSWPEEMKRLRASDPTAFHDRLILLHPAPYAGIPSERVDPSLDDAGWTMKSQALRLEHEFTHHATHRILGSYRLHVHDEVLADLMGFTKAIGRWDADLFLLGLGIDGDRIVPGARLLAYVQSLSEGDLPSLLPIVDKVARNLESVADLFLSDDPLLRLRRMLLLAGNDLRQMTDPQWPAAFRACPSI
ncbi:MAG: hypothetical protein CMJ67_04225 [Planctomycetaceae bacterium]|nr:hypothetical protein [Planctomycetaceae bacterium]